MFKTLFAATHPRASLIIATLAASAASSLEACGPSCADYRGSIAAVIGVGDPSNPTLFTRLADGDTVQLTTGNQGGQHVWIQLRATGLCPLSPTARVRAVREADGARVGQATSNTLAWTPVPGQAGNFSSETLAVQIDDRYFCSLLDGGRLRFDWSIDDTRGTPAQGSVRAVLRGWSADSAEDLRMGREQCCMNTQNSACWPDGPPATGDGGAGDAAVDASSDASTTSDATTRD